MTMDVMTAADHLVGNLYFNLGAVAVLAARLHPDDMPETPGKTVYREMCRLHLSPNERLSAGTLESALRAVNFDFRHITDLQSRVVFESIESLEEYADAINGWADKQELKRRLARAIDDADKEDVSAEQLIPELMRSVSAVNRSAKNRGRYIEEIMAELRRDARRWKQGEAQEGLLTGFTDLDKVIRLVPGDLILLAARPSMGKTSLAMQIAENVARMYPDKQVVVFSAEMTDKSLGMRMVSSSASVNVHRLRSNVADPDEYDTFIEGTTRFDGVPLYVDDESTISTDQMYYRTAMLNAQKPVSLVLFDFVELGADSGPRRNDGEEQRISAIAKGLKAIAKNLNLPVIALSQLSRKIEDRADKLPILADLRYSGMLEQISDVVIFLMRPEYYIKRKQQCYIEKDSHREGVCYVIVAKYRNGPAARVNLHFTEKYTRFADLAFDRYSIGE